MFLTQNFEILIFVWNCCPHECKCRTENPIQIWALKREVWKIKSNKVLHIPMQIELDNRKAQNWIHKICHVLLTDDQNEMPFSSLCFSIEREHFWQKLNFWFFGTKTTFFIKITDFWNSNKTLFNSFNNQHYRNEIHFPFNWAGIKRDGMDSGIGILEHFILGAHCSAQLLL